MGSLCWLWRLELDTVRRLRQALRLSRSKFAPLLGVSEVRVEQLETVVPADLLVKMYKLATERGLHDLAAEFAREMSPEARSAENIPCSALASRIGSVAHAYPGGVASRYGTLYDPSTAGTITQLIADLVDAAGEPAVAQILTDLRALAVGGSRLEQSETGGIPGPEYAPEPQPVENLEEMGGGAHKKPRAG